MSKTQSETQDIQNDVNPAQEAEQTEQAAELNISDLNTLRAIIDLASSRGAFKPTEMVTIGTTYSKLDSFLNKVAEQADAQQKVQEAQ